MSDKEIIKISNQFTRGILGGRDARAMCYAVTSPLQCFLELCGLQTEIIEGEIDTGYELWSHFWLKLPDGRILDPTASQFKTPDGVEMPKTFLGEKPEWYKTLE